MAKQITIKHYSKKSNGTAFTKSGEAIKDLVFDNILADRCEIRKYLEKLGMKELHETDSRGNPIYYSQEDLMIKVCGGGDLF